MESNSATNASSENDAPTPLYRLFEQYRQVVQTHILTKLDTNSKKFLYDVNTTTRAVMRDGGIELPRSFQVKELESISAISLAWDAYENGQFRGYPNEEKFFARVVLTNKLELVRWLREETYCDWDFQAYLMAVVADNVDILRYLFAEECPFFAPEFQNEFQNVEVLYAHAAAHNSLASVKYLQEARSKKQRLPRAFAIGRLTLRRRRNRLGRHGGI